MENEVNCLQNEGWSNTILTIIILIVVVSLGFAYYLTGEDSEEPVGKAEIVSVSHAPKNPTAEDNITLKTKVKGTSQPVKYLYHCYFEISETAKASGTFMTPTSEEGEYSTQLLLNPKNGMEISCFIITWDDNGNPLLSDEHIIQIGSIERSDKSTLKITNITHGTPPNPNTSTSIDIQAEIRTDAPPVEAEIIPFYYGKNKTFSLVDRFGDKMNPQPGNTYQQEILPPFTPGKWPSNVTVQYKIVAEDNSGNTAVSQWENFVIS